MSFSLITPTDFSVARTNQLLQRARDVAPAMIAALALLALMLQWGPAPDASFPAVSQQAPATLEVALAPELAMVALVTDTQAQR